MNEKKDGKPLGLSSSLPPSALIPFLVRATLPARQASVYYAKSRNARRQPLVGAHSLSAQEFPSFFKRGFQQ